MPTTQYVVRVSPDRIVLRTPSRNSASALFRNVVKAAKRGEGRLASSTITLEEDGRVLTRFVPTTVTAIAA